jgi:hypothetical protein
MEPPPSPTAQDDATPAWRWQYTAEVWASDGLVVGVFGSSSFGEDDEHAKRIALGQAILANAGPRADAFDPAGAAAFIVSKERILGAVRPPNGSC